MTDRIHVSYFSDILCVWAYVSQVRLDELQRQHGHEIVVDHHFIPIFGSTAHRIGEGWADRGGWESYAAHVAEVCADFPHVELSPEVWTTVRPTTSAISHQFLKALELVESESEARESHDEFGGRSLFEEAAWQLRLAFFRDGRDVSRIGDLWDILIDLALPVDAIIEQIESGRAMAALCHDVGLRDEYKIDGSPTYVLNHGRQKLYGNLGYKVIEANVEEVLRRPDDAASWC
jgi:predicted DsbA family dithiol-disulfide isomerase